MNLLFHFLNSVRLFQQLNNKTKINEYDFSHEKLPRVWILDLSWSNSIFTALEPDSSPAVTPTRTGLRSSKPPSMETSALTCEKIRVRNSVDKTTSFGGGAMGTQIAFAANKTMRATRKTQQNGDYLMLFKFHDACPIMNNDIFFPLLFFL